MPGYSIVGISKVPSFHWAALLPYLGSGLVGRIALQWWPSTMLCFSFSRSGRVPSQTASFRRNRTFMARSHLHWWRWTNLVVRPAWVTAQPKALDCRSLSLHDYRSRALDSSPQRCLSSVRWGSWVLRQWPPHRRHPLCGRQTHCHWNSFCFWLSKAFRSNWCPVLTVSVASPLMLDHL